jgi:hypothetical protein
VFLIFPYWYLLVLIGTYWFLVAKIGKNWRKLIYFYFFEKVILYCIRSKNVWDVFHDLKNVEIATKSLNICQFWPILATFYEFKSCSEKSW